MSEWVDIVEDKQTEFLTGLDTYPPEGEAVLVSDGENYDVAWYLRSSEYVWMKSHVANDTGELFDSFVPIKWRLID